MKAEDRNASLPLSDCQQRYPVYGFPFFLVSAAWLNHSTRLLWFLTLLTRRRDPLTRTKFCLSVAPLSHNERRDGREEHALVQTEDPIPRRASHSTPQPLSISLHCHHRFSPPPYSTHFSACLLFCFLSSCVAHYLRNASSHPSSPSLLLLPGTLYVPLRP